ncbi:MAG: SpaA isopeptide-forming pilin-related protein [Clostridium sp.]|nr:SpaA isopeptide-forming pilin-related protein [Clostridium sp.]
MNRKRFKRVTALLMAVVLAASAAIPTGSFAFASGVDAESTDGQETIAEESREPEVYDSALRKELEAVEVATAVDIVVAAGYGFDVEQDFEGISYNEDAVSVSYYAGRGSFDGDKAGEYETYYKVVPISGKEPYLICRTISVREPETAQASDSGKSEDGEEEPEPEVPDLAEGEMPELTTDTPVTFRLTSEAVMMAADVRMAAKASDKDSMKVSNNGYAKYCGHSIGVKYISQSGDYYHHLVYCLDMNKNTTSGTVSSSGSTSKIKPTVTYCLVNGARTLNGTCHNSKYSSGSATQDYFITSAAIHVLNGEVGLSYYNNGSGTYSKIASLVSDAKKHGDDYADNGLTKSVTYSISPKKSEWKDMGDGLYRSADKFVRTKKGTITDVKYTITGAPAGLTVGEIKTDSSEIEDESDLKKYDICVAQTDAGKESSNFYLFCNEDALKKIQAEKATIKVKGKAYADEKGGRKWTPTVVSQQKITFLEEFNVKSDEATVKVTSEYKLGKFELFKTDKFTNGPVEGAKYYLYEDKDCDDLFSKLSKTDGNGLAATDVEVLTQDTYYLKEVLEPDGYQKDETVYPVGLEYFTLYDANGKVTQQGKQMTVDETPDKVGVFVHKTDSDSGNIVAGAGFAVFKDAGCTQRVLTEGSTGAEVPVFYYDEDLDMAASEKFVKEQETYYVKEVVIPDGYRDDGTVYPVSPAYGAFEKVDVPNTPIRCDVSAVKEDKETGLEKDGDAKLSGALYGLYAAEEIKYPDGRAVVTYDGADNITSTKGTEFVSTGNPADKDALLATVRTDEAYSFDFGNLYYGNYYIKEIEASEGYLLDETAYPVNFKAADNTHQDISLACKVVETVKKQAFEIIKVSTDGDNNEAEKIPGAEFTVKLKSDIAADGWDGAKAYDVFTTDENGYAKSKELPYGTYLVKETKVPSELYKTDDFEVVVTEDSREPQIWKVLNDSSFKAYIRMVKKDAESGKTVLLSGVAFKIRNMETDAFVEQKVGDKQISEFITDETGTVTTPLKLKHGSYAVEEITAPEGYLIAGDSFPFPVTKEGAVKVEEDAEGDPVIEVVAENTSVKGSITIHKTGEVLAGTEYETIVDRILSRLTGSERGVRFVYEEQNLSGAVFHVVAEETVYTPDCQKGEDGERQTAIIGGIPAVKGAVVATLVTDENGMAKIDGLPLGKYQIVEVTPPEGFALCEEPQSVELSYADQNTEIVYGDAEFVNARVKTELSLVKTDSETTNPVSGAVYGIYAAEDIVKVNGGQLKPAQAASSSAAVADGSTADDGAISSTEESGAASGDAVDGADKDREDSEDLDETEGSKESGTVTEDSEDAGDFDGSKTEEADSTQPSEAENTRSPETGNTEKGEVLISAGSLVGVAETDENGKAVFDADLPLGNYVLKEIESPEGYLLDETEHPVDFTYQEPTVTVIAKELEVKDTPLIVEVSKTDITTGNELSGATLEIIDSEGKTYAAWKTDGKPYRLEAIPAGDYTLRETASPYGYLIAGEVDFTVEEVKNEDGSPVIQKVAMSDERVKGKILLYKTDSKTGKPIKGVEFELRDKAGKVLGKLTTDKVGYAETGLLDICTYDKAGNFKEDIPYYIVETKAADGYILDDTPHEVLLQYDDSAVETVVYTLKLKNKPDKPRLPQTGGNYHPWLTILAGGALAGAGIYIYRRKRKKAG